MFLDDISAEDIMTIIGPKGEITVEGTQKALDITDILNKDEDLFKLFNLYLSIQMVTLLRLVHYIISPEDFG